MPAKYWLTAEQEIRSDALDSAARLLGPCIGDVFGEAPYEAVLTAVGDEWLRLAAAGARYIETGKFAPDLAAEPAAESEAVDVRQS